MHEGQKVPVGTPLAEIMAAGAGTASGTGTGAATKTETAAAAETAAAPATGAARAKPLPLASPAVRRRAHELDVSLEGLHGTGDHGRITLEDVKGATRAEAQPRASRAWVRMSPYARRLAHQRGVDIGRVRGSGPAGAIVAKDVLGAEASKPPEQLSAADRM